MAGESFLDLEAVAFNCLDCMHSEPPKPNIAYEAMSLLRMCNQPASRAMLEMIETLFDGAGYMRDRDYALSSFRLDPVLRTLGPMTSALYDEALSFLSNEFAHSPISKTFLRLDELKRKRIQAASRGDLASLRRLEADLVHLKRGCRDPFSSAAVANQHAVNASERYALGDVQGLRESFDELCLLVPGMPAGRLRSTITANACYSASLLYQHDGDAACLKRALDVIPAINQRERKWGYIANVVRCYLALHEEDPERYSYLLDEAVKMVPRDVPHDFPEAAVDVAQNLANVYSALARVTHDERYIGLGNSINERLLNTAPVNEVRMGQIKLNYAVGLVQQAEMETLSNEETEKLLKRAVDMARAACDVSARHAVPAEHQATDMEGLASSLRALARTQVGGEQGRNLGEALRYAEEAMRKTPAYGAAWHRHAEVRNHVLYDLATLDEDQWGGRFLSACRETLTANPSSALTSWLYGNWMASHERWGAEMFERLLVGARKQASPVVRADRFLNILALLMTAATDDEATSYFDVLDAVLRGLLADFRQLLWSPRGQDATRGAAASLSWLGAVLADLALREDGDVSQALVSLGTVANGIWAMNVSATSGVEAENVGGADPYYEGRSLLRTETSRMTAPRYERADSPTLLVLTPGVVSGWAIIRSHGSADIVVELPGCSDREVRGVVDEYGAILDGGKLRRGAVPAFSPDCLEWVAEAIVQPLIDSRVDPGDWIAWCPTGSLIGLPLHGVDFPGVKAHSYVTDPLFEPNGLQSHASTACPRPSFLGWSTYPSSLGDLPGVIAESRTFKRVVGSRPQLDVDPWEMIVAENEPLHLACHGAGTSSRGDAVLALGHRSVSMQEAIVTFGGSRAFVFLNACLAAQPAPRLEEQHLTLVKAFLLAGARSVVGSLWTVADADGAPDVLIEGFYGALLRGPMVCCCERCVAIALQRAVRQLKDCGLTWIDWLNWTHTIG